jgi:hypothetical protein
LLQLNDGRPSSSSGLRGRRRTYHTILKLADLVLFKIVRYVLLRSLRPELDGQMSFKFMGSRLPYFKYGFVFIIIYILFLLF